MNISLLAQWSPGKQRVSLRKGVKYMGISVSITLYMVFVDILEYRSG